MLTADRPIDERSKNPTCALNCYNSFSASRIHQLKFKSRGAYHLSKNSGIFRKKKLIQAFSVNSVRKFRSTSRGTLSSRSERKDGKLFTICSFLSFSVSCPREFLAQLMSTWRLQCINACFCKNK